MGDIKCHRPLSIESVLLPAEGKRPQRSFIFGSYAFQMPNWNEPSEVDDECRQLNEYPPDGKRPSSLKPHLSYCYLKRMLEPHSMLQERPLHSVLRPAENGKFEGNIGSIQREERASMQREETPTMTTGLERIAAKARKKRTLRFTSLAHHLTRERVGRIRIRSPTSPRRVWINKRCRRQKRVLGNGWMGCCTLSIVKAIERRLSDVSISRGQASRRNAREGYRLWPTGRYSAVWLRSCRPSTGRIFCPVHLAGDLDGAPIKRSQPFQKP